MDFLIATTQCRWTPNLTLKRLGQAQAQRGPPQSKGKWFHEGRREIVNNYLFDTIQPICESESRITRKEAHHNMIEIFIPTLKYRRAVADFAAAMGLDPDAVKITLGEDFNVWPESIKRDRRR